MKVAIVSDSHDHWQNLKQAIAGANQAGCTALLHAGDLIAPMGVQMLAEFRGQVHYVWGNNEGEKLGISRAIDKLPNVILHGREMSLELDERKIYMNHYPHISQMAAATGEYDVAIYGHDHLYFEEKKDHTLLLNPGELCGYRTKQATFMMLDLKTLQVEKHSLE